MERTIASLVTTEHIDILGLQEVAFSREAPEHQTQSIVSAVERTLAAHSGDWRERLAGLKATHCACDDDRDSSDDNRNHSDDEPTAKRSTSCDNTLHPCERASEADGKAAGAAVTSGSVHAYHCPTVEPCIREAARFHIDGPAVLVCHDSRPLRSGGVAPSLRVIKHELHHMDDGYSAQRILVHVDDWGREGDAASRRMWFVNTHLESALTDEGRATRLRQSQSILDWLDAAKGEACHVVIAGDFNAAPLSPPYELLKKHGYTSSHAAVHGSEPEHTFPSGLQAPFMDLDPAMTTDYVWFTTLDAERAGGRLTAGSAKLIGSLPHEDDLTLFASDHIGIVAELNLECVVATATSAHDDGSASTL